jgi:hypothetical protein
VITASSFAVGFTLVTCNGAGSGVLLPVVISDGASEGASTSRSISGNDGAAGGSGTSLTAPFTAGVTTGTAFGGISVGTAGASSVSPACAFTWFCTGSDGDVVGGTASGTSAGASEVKGGSGVTCLERAFSCFLTRRAALAAFRCAVFVSFGAESVGLVWTGQDTTRILIPGIRDDIPRRLRWLLLGENFLFAFLAGRVDRQEIKSSP